MPTAGRKNALGSLHGPRSDAWLNGSHGVLLAMGRHNSDVQLPQRLPIQSATHCEECHEPCVSSVSTSEISRAAQTAQAAQVGYSTDYANKRQGVALHECREFSKGHRAMAETELQDAPAGYISRRHMQRVIADCFSRGCVRGSVETASWLLLALPLCCGFGQGSSRCAFLGRQGFRKGFDASAERRT